MDKNVFRPDELNHQLLTFEDALRVSGLSAPELHRLLLTDILHALKFYPRQRASFAPAEYRQLWFYEVELMQPEDLRELFFSKGELQELNPSDEEGEVPPEVPVSVSRQEDGLQLSFFKRGPSWLIGEQGRELSFPDLRGFHMLHYLLERQEERVSAHDLYHLGCPPIEEIELLNAAGVGLQIADACRKKVQKAIKSAVNSLRAEFEKSERTRRLTVYFDLADAGTVKTGFDNFYRPPDRQPRPVFLLIVNEP
jgi:hypothetical protein